MKLITSLILSTSLLALADVKVTVGDLTDKRTTGKFFAGMDVDLKISGPELADCKGIRIIVKEAKDDTGKAIKAKEGGFNDGGFDTPQKAFGGFGDDEKKKEPEFQLKIELENPARAAKTFTVDASLELLIPSKDPKALVTVDIAKEAGKPLASESLKAAGATITMKAAKDDEVGYTISDPNKKVATVEFCTADGKPLERSGTMSSGFFGKKDMTVTLREKAPAGVLAKIFLITEISVVSVPVKLAGVALP